SFLLGLNYLLLGALPGEIIGGWEARPHSRPYMAFVSREIRRNRGSRCGGFLIREDVVVHAAHCNCNLP
uniref:Peptidase S1 domain-containing protein n=1 Tax=Chrysemys picta bellii TaxID=8478 RepID=A0A8C3IPN9_CHRPI